VDAGRIVADWRSAAPYDALCRCDRHGFAWEWLRRSTVYQTTCAAAGAQASDASRFGLHHFEGWNRGVSAARPVWTANVDPFVLAAAASMSPSSNDLFDAARAGSLATCHLDGAGEHWLFSDGWCQVRLDIVEGSLRSGPRRLDYSLGGLAGALPAALTLRRLAALARTGRLIPSLFPPERRARRWALVLRAHDAIVAGATQREIALHLLGLEPLPRWRIEAPSYRRRVQRLVEAARSVASADSRRWLAGHLA